MVRHTIQHPTSDIQNRHRTAGQAMVEFALAATLIFFLLAAAIDLGLLFFTKQGVTNAAQEGATFGSRWLEGTSPRVLNVPEIQKRVRFESGENGGNGVLRLTDLNSDGVDDASQAGVIDPSGATGFIQVRAIADTNLDGNPVNDGLVACTDAAKSAVSCYAWVTVEKVHRLFFPLSPAFGNEFSVKSSYYMLIRDTYRTGNSAAPPTFEQPTPTPDPNSLVVEWVNPGGTTFSNNRNGTNFEVRAYDKSKGTTNGDGILKVVIRVYRPGGSELAFAEDFGAKYCLFSGNCNSMSSSLWNTLTAGTYTFEATATSKAGQSKTITKTVTK